MQALENPSYIIFTKGTVIFREGDPGDNAYLIQSGTVDIVVKGGNGEKVIDTLAVGDFFGEMAFIGFGAWSRDALISHSPVG